MITAARLASAAGLCALAPLGGCQAILGLDDYQIEAPAQGGSGGAGGGQPSGGQAGSAGVGGGGAGDVPDGGGTAGLNGCGGTCDPSLISIQGTVHEYDTGLPHEDVVVESSGNDSTTDAQGHFSLLVPPGELQGLTLNWPLAESEELTLPFRRTVLAFEPRALPAAALEVPVVRHAWLEALARDCGALPTDAPASVLDSYFEERITLLVEVVGQNAAGITRDQIDVYVERDGESYANFGVPDATDPYPPTICFLETGDAGGGLRGGTSNQTNASGQLVVFRVRNRSGTGSGTVNVRIVNFGPPPPVAVSSAGVTAAVRVGGDW